MSGGPPRTPTSHLVGYKKYTKKNVTKKKRRNDGRKDGMKER